MCRNGGRLLSEDLALLIETNKYRLTKGYKNGKLIETQQYDYFVAN